MPGVSGSLQNTDQGIVHDESKGTCEVDLEIGDGLREYIRGGAHPDENLWGEEDADQSHDDGEDKPQGNRHMNGSFYIFIIFSPDIVGNDDAGTDGDAVEETDHHEDEIAGGGYGGEGVTSDEITDNQRIRGVIELLEEIAEEEW